MKFWIARDKNNQIFLHLLKPFLTEDGRWFNESDEYIRLDDTVYSEITFENSPKEAELRLVRNFREKYNDYILEHIKEEVEKRINDEKS